MDYDKLESEFICQVTDKKYLIHEDGQCRELLMDMIKSVRSCSLDVDAQEYKRRLNDIVRFLEDLRFTLNDDEMMTKEQLEWFKESDVWSHKVFSGLTRKEDNVWPLRRFEFYFTVEFYLKRNYLWCDSVDFVLVDAMLYDEAATTKQQIIKNGMWFTGKKNWWYYLFNLVRILFWLSVLFYSYSVDKFLFLALAGWLIYTRRIEFESTELSRIMIAYKSLERIYSISSERWLSVERVWQACLSGSEKGCVYDSRLWFILERQRYNKARAGQ